MNPDYEKLAHDLDFELSGTPNVWPTTAEFQNAAKRIIAASGLLEEVERLQRALHTYGQHHLECGMKKCSCGLSDELKGPQ